MLGGGGAGGGGFGAGGIDMGSSNFQDTILGEATRAAVDDMVAQLVSQAGKIEATQVTIDGLIADATGDVIVINVGKAAGVSPGMRFNVERVTREVKDPATGKVLRKISSPVGEIEVTEADEGSAVAKAISGTAFNVGDVVKSK
jgi:hypothetical protein